MLNKLRLWLIAALIAVMALTTQVAIAAQSAPTEGASLSGIAFRLSNNAGKEAIISQNKGSTAPSYATAGLIWLDDAATPWLVKQYDGADWITLGAVNSSTNTFTPYYGTAPLRLLNFASDTGGANVYAIAPSPAISAYVTGQMVTLKPAHANTGASTINVNGVGIKSIKNGDGSDLASGTLNASGFYLLAYDGANFVLVGGGGVTEANITLSDVTTNNSSTTKHGFLKKLSNDASTYMDGAGNWTTPAGRAVSVQVFASSGTWIKPSTGTMAFVQAWGAGGSGGLRNTSIGSGGGGGGAYSEALIPLSSLGSTVSVTVGTGGAAKTTISSGDDGGDSSFGSFLTAVGGKKGISSATGADISGGTGGGVSATFSNAGAPNRNGGHSDGDFGGGGGGGWQTGGIGGDSGRGGGGGGGSGNTAAINAGGFSGNGGHGGAGGTTGVAGSAPGGGGGGGRSGTSGAGARGEVRIYVY